MDYKQARGVHKMLMNGFLFMIGAFLACAAIGCTLLGALIGMRFAVEYMAKRGIKCKSQS